MKFKSKDLVILEGKYMNEAVRTRTQVVYKNELYKLISCGPMIAEISRNGSQLSVYSSEIFITRSTKKRLDRSLRQLRQQEKTLAKIQKREETWMKDNTPSILSVEL